MSILLVFVVDWLNRRCNRLTILHLLVVAYLVVQHFDLVVVPDMVRRTEVLDILGHCFDLVVVVAFHHRSYHHRHVVGSIQYFGAHKGHIRLLGYLGKTHDVDVQKLTTSAVSMIGFSLGNALGPQFWLEKYKPTNRVPWGLTLMAALVSVSCTLALRYLFARENHRRDAMKAEAMRTGASMAPFNEWSLVETVGPDGKIIRRKLDKMYLDLTDGENLAFRYVL